MKKNSIKFYNEEVYYEVLDNGLEIYVIPNSNVNDIYVTFTAKYGGCNYKFKYNNEYIKVPNGIAHFLEHKMFEQENGIDPFTFYNKTGTYCNASTNYYSTSYLIAGKNDFENNLNYLLDFVQTPYFTDKNVEKEKGIIKQEIKMYDDMPDNILFEKTLYNLFNVHPMKYSIAGTVKDINSITKEDLYKCYNTFYNPKNMFIIITGNIDSKKAIEIIKRNQNKKKFNDICIEVEEIKEPDEVCKKHEIIKHNVTIPYVSYAIKIPLSNFNIDRKKLNIYLSNMFNILFDETSEFYENMKNKKLLDTYIDIDNFDAGNHKVFMLTFKSKKYDKVLKEIDNILNNIKINANDLERKKKVNISNMLYIFDDIAKTNRLFLSNKIIYNDIYLNVYDIFDTLNIDELSHIINNINLKNKSTLIIESSD